MDCYEFLYLTKSILFALEHSIHCKAINLYVCLILAKKRDRG